MRPIKFSQKEILKPFYREKVLTKEQLLQIFGCSAMTAWRILSAHGYISSYNFNARYYTLADVPVFDEHGLWSYQKARFSRYGSLTDTVRALIYNSTSGLKTKELQQLLTVNVTPILTKLYQQGKFHREKMDGMFVYFQTDKHGWRKQLSRRQSETMKKSRMRLPEPELIIAVLVELIQRVELQPQQLARRLSRKGIKVNTAQIQAIFLHYGLRQKKTG